jgi:hypothetical protein
MKAVGMKTNYDSLMELELPLIALVKSSGHENSDHYIVVDKISPKQVEVWWDPSQGHLVLQRQKFQKIWSGYVLSIAAPKLRNQKHAPHIEIDEPIYDFGTAAQMENVQHTFVIRNVGQKPLEILKVVPACTCEDVKLRDRSIPPGGLTTLDMVYRGQGTGKSRASVSLITNDPDEQRVVMSMVGVITGVVGVSQGHFYLGEIGQDKSIKRSFDIHRPRFREAKIKLVKSSSPKIKVKLRKLRSKELLARVDFEIEAGLPRGSLKERITVVTDDVRYPEIQVSIEGTVVGDILVRPDQFFMGFLDIGVPVRPTVTLEKRGKADLKVLGVENTLPIIQVKWTTVEPGRKYQIDAICTPAATPARSIRDVVRIHTDNASQPVVEISLYGILK